MSIKELHDVAVTFDEAFARYQATIEEARRQWSAKLLREFPDKPALEAIAERLRTDLDAHQVHINAVDAEVQTTVAKAPPGRVTSIAVGNSLCALVIGLGETAMVADVQNDSITAKHSAKKIGLRSWASAPIEIEQVDAGAVCALEIDRPREWTDYDQDRLESAAAEIGQLVGAWAATIIKTSDL